MDNNIDTMITNLEEYRSTHPNLINVLTTYLKIKKDNLLRTFILCNKITDNLDNISDPEITQLLVIFNLLHSRRL